MSSKLFPIVFSAALVLPGAMAQDRWEAADFKNANLAGLHLNGISIYSGYTTLTGPSNPLTSAPAPGIGNLGGSITYGAQWSAGWRRTRENSTITALYSGGYSGQTSYSNLNAFSHMFTLGASKTVLKKWTLNFNLNGQYSTLAQYLYQPSAVSTISQTPATFQDLAAVYAIGAFSDMQVASMLTGTPLTTTTAASGLLLGDRVLTYGAQLSAVYQASSRLSVSLSSFTAGGRSDLEGKSTIVMPKTIGGNAGVSFSYSLTPRTSFKFSAMETRAANQYQKSYGTNVEAGFGRKMGPHWFLDGGAGAAYIKVTQQSSGTPPESRQLIGHGSLGYRTYSSTFIVSYNRGTYDSYGLAAGQNTNAVGAWTWHRPGSGWMLTTGFGRQQIRDTGFMNISGWQGNAGISRNLGGQFSLRSEYIYFDSTGTFLGNTLNRTIHTVRTSLAWTPQPVNR